jgi:hypothetical protein
MTVKKMTYLKEGTTEEQSYDLLILNKDETHENGIALNYLKEEERTAVLEIQRKYEEELKPFIKAYRSFLKKGIKVVE